MECLVYLADVLWSCFVVFPSSVLFWAGTWRLLDYFFTLGDIIYIAIVLAVIGFTGSFMGYFLLPTVGRYVRPGENHFVGHLLFSRLFIYAEAVFFVCYWRGLFGLLGATSWSTKVPALCGQYVLAQFLLIALRVTSQSLWTPFTLCIDTRRDFYTAFPRFRTQATSIWKYFLDSFFTALIIYTLPIIVWQSGFGLQDHIIPDSKDLSNIVSLSIGLSLTLILLALPWTFRSVDHEHVILRGAFVLEVTFNVTGTMACILLWRGVWGIINTHVLYSGDAGAWRAWLCHGIGMAVLMCTQTSSTVAFVGCVIDGEKGFMWPIMYWHMWKRIFLQGNSSLTGQHQHQDEPDTENNEKTILTHNGCPNRHYDACVLPGAS